MLQECCRNAAGIVPGILQEYRRNTAGILQEYHRNTAGMLQEYCMSTARTLQKYWMNTVGKRGKMQLDIARHARYIAIISIVLDASGYSQTYQCSMIRFQGNLGKLLQSNIVPFHVFDLICSPVFMRYYILQRASRSLAETGFDLTPAVTPKRVYRKYGTVILEKSKVSSGNYTFIYFKAIWAPGPYFRLILGPVASFS